MDHNLKRVDGRRKADTNLVQYHQLYIATWEGWRDHIIDVDDTDGDEKQALHHYMLWFRLWASLYLLNDHIDPLMTYYSRALAKQAYVEHILAMEDIFQLFFGRSGDSDLQMAINRYEKICHDLRLRMHISDYRLRHVTIEYIPH